MNSGVAMTADGVGHSFAEPTEPSIAEKDVKASRLFVHLVLFFALILQRFGMISGNSALFVALPGMLVLLGWLIYTGRARIDTNLGVYYLAFIAMVALSTTIAFAFPDNRVSLSLFSPIAVLANYGMFLVKPNQRFDRTVVLDVFMFYARLCTVLGIIQYLIQFVGISFFAWSISFPALKPILIEQVFNFDPVTYYGAATRRSTGVFLLEPSIFSQLLVLAAVIDFFLYRRIRWMLAYAIAYLFTYSGTGVLSLLLALPPFILLFHRQAGRLVTLGIVGLGLLAIAAVLLPNQLQGLTSRSDELAASHSSGHARFVGQFEVIDAVIDEPRALIGYGPGSLERATFFIGGTTGPIQKLTVDYGIIGFLIFMAFILKAFWRWDMAIVPLIVLAQFMAGGGYFVLSPLIVQFVLLSAWALPPKQAAAEPARSRWRPPSFFPAFRR